MVHKARYNVWIESTQYRDDDFLPAIPFDQNNQKMPPRFNPMSWIIPRTNRYLEISLFILSCIERRGSGSAHLVRRSLQPIVRTHFHGCSRSCSKLFQHRRRSIPQLWSSTVHFSFRTSAFTGGALCAVRWNALLAWIIIWNFQIYPHQNRDKYRVACFLQSR